MATKDRATDAVVIRRLLSEGHRFSFYQAVNLLQLASAGSSPIGLKGPASKEAIRLRPSTSLAFPSSEVASVEEIRTVQGLERFLVTVNFFGLYGSDSPLPAIYGEDVLLHDRDDEVLRNFLDIFHHRLLSFLYVCGTKYRYPLQFEPGGRDRHSRRLFSMIGLRDAAVRRAVGVPAIRLLRYAGLITQRPHSAFALSAILSDYFDGLRIRTEQCIEQWVFIRVEDQNRLGDRNCRLGRDCSLGERIYDRQGKFRICLGPVGLSLLLKYLPGTDGFHALCMIVRFFAPDSLDYELMILLLRGEVPELRLNTKDSERLGWTTWLGNPEEETVPVVLQNPGSQI